MKTPEEIADEIIETANDATRIVDGAHSCPAGHDDEDVDYFCCGCLRSMIAAAISAERSAGTVPPAPKPVAAPDVKQQLRQAVEDPLLRCAPDVVAFQASITDEQIERMEARSRELPDEPEDEEVEVCPPKPAPACARCGGSGEIVAHASAVRNPGGGIERIVRRFEPCPECRGKP